MGCRKIKVGKAHRSATPSSANSASAAHMPKAVWKVPCGDLQKHQSPRNWRFVLSIDAPHQEQRRDAIYFSLTFLGLKAAEKAGFIGNFTRLTRLACWPLESLLCSASKRVVAARSWANHLTIRSSRTCFTAPVFYSNRLLYWCREASRLNSGVRWVVERSRLAKCTARLCRPV